ncbi:MAG TPA: glycosyltransferase, partial [Candidatus Eisenbacteria bacterium]|nr:glycosyltransferase [Candidatus Eisenbacteria bacterium]
MARIVLTTFGSLGDLHPFVAIGRALAARGHAASLATHASYRERVETAGLGFHPVRPDFPDFGDLAEAMRGAMDARRGSEFVARRLVLPHLRASRDDLLAACAGADLIVDHALTFSAPLVAARLGVPRVSTSLQPLTLFSAHDPPHMPARPALAALRGAGPLLWRPLWRLARRASAPWFAPLAELRADMGLPPTRAHPLFDGASPLLHLALFSRVLASPQPDWPPATRLTGFPFALTPAEAAASLPPAVREFLAAGEPPLVFTLGSAAVWTGAAFYAAAAGAAARLGR